jgi:hypothetical protein
VQGRKPWLCRKSKLSKQIEYELRTMDDCRRSLQPACRPLNRYQ